jgi:hypothetical protein
MPEAKDAAVKKCGFYLLRTPKHYLLRATLTVFAALTVFYDLLFIYFICAFLFFHFLLLLLFSYITRCLTTTELYSRCGAEWLYLNFHFIFI